MTCNGDCNQGRECNCECKMTKDEALRMAINALTNCSAFEKTIQACKEALAETQEPVAYVCIDSDAKETSNIISVELQCHTELYTTPPSREWVGLSDEEIEEAVNYLNVKIDYPIMFARLIEMHLKEKNG